MSVHSIASVLEWVLEPRSTHAAKWERGHNERDMLLSRTRASVCQVDILAFVFTLPSPGLQCQSP